MGKSSQVIRAIGLQESSEGVSQQSLCCACVHSVAPWTAKELSKHLGVTREQREKRKIAQRKLWDARRCMLEMHFKQNASHVIRNGHRLPASTSHYLDIHNRVSCWVDWKHVYLG